MVAVVSKIPPSIYCSSEWHLQDSPRAATIYNLALKLSNGGEATFYLSQPQIALYFRWSLNAVKAAFRFLKKSGLFVLMRKGRGGDVRSDDFANVYRVLKHSELPEDGKHWVKPEKDTQGKKRPGVKKCPGAESDPSPGAEFDPSPGAKNDPLISEESTKKSSISSKPLGAARAGYYWDDPDPWWTSDEAEKLDPDGSLRQRAHQEEHIIKNIPPELSNWVANLQPLALPSITEAEAATAFHAMGQLLLNGAAKLFGTARGATSTLVDYDRVWGLDEKYGASASAALAQKILDCGVGDNHNYPVSVRSFVWDHLCDAATATPSPTN